MITGISSMAVRQILVDLGVAYEQQAGIAARIESVGGVEAARRVSQGEAFDFVVLAAEAIAQLADSGHVDPASRTDVARSGMAIAIAAGAPRPDVRNEAAVRETVANARGVGYSTGPSGKHLVSLFARWGITPRLVQAPPGVPVGGLVARGEVELGFQQLSELIHLPDIDVIDTLPAGVQLITTFSAAVCTAARQAGEAREFLSFLAAPQSAAAKRSHGMEPA